MKSKNRVAAVRYESDDSSARTSETIRRFPLSDKSISLGSREGNNNQQRKEERWNRKSYAAFP